ncbi:MAG: type II toxin-antitoxin system PemK/MazF family toxin [Elusimicrobiota bacterium]
MRGEIYWVNLDPTLGSEIRKTRPALVVSNDANNIHSQTVTVLPITSSVAKVYPFEVFLPAGSCGNKEACKAKADQIRTVDKRRLGKPMGFASSAVLAAADRAMRLHLGLAMPDPSGWVHDFSRPYGKKR